MRLDVLLTTHSGLDVSRSKLGLWIKSGRVKLDGKVVRKPALQVSGSGSYQIDCVTSSAAEMVPEKISLDILYEDADILIVNKPAGMVVHPGAGVSRGTLVHALLGYGCALSQVGGTFRQGIVHRLDKGTTGAMVVAKTDRAHLKLIQMFAERKMEKTYLAILLGQLRKEHGKMESFLGRHPVHRKKISSRAKSGKWASTEWWRLVASHGLTFVRVRLATGRTHQIRAHFSEMGFPLLGDRAYGVTERREAPVRAMAMAGTDAQVRPLLHAWGLVFDHPTSGQKLCFEAPIPHDMGWVLENLRWNPPKLV